MKKTGKASGGLADRAERKMLPWRVVRNGSPKKDGTPTQPETGTRIKTRVGN